MTEKVTKIRFYVDYDKEEQWINEMCQQGWHLVKFGFGYFTFEKGTPGEYIYRNEMLTELGKKDTSKDYIAFLDESGVELVSQFFNWAYFRKKAEDGPFELYSDTASKIQYLNRIFYLFLFFAMINYFFAITNLLDFLEEDLFSLIIGIVNLLAALLISFPLVLVRKRLKALRSNLTIFHD